MTEFLLFPALSHVLVELRVSVVDRRVKSKFLCKEASFFAFVLKSLFFAKKIQKQGIWMLWKSLFS